MSTKHVDIWDTETFEMRKSARRYIEVSGLSVGIEQETNEGYTHTDHRNLPLYLDPVAGVVVWDIAAYERNIAQGVR